MLFNCPECNLQVSDKAVTCPHCGNPLKEENSILHVSKRRNKKKNKYRKLPNGFGQITEIKGRNLRNPFRVMITVGKTTEGRPISKLLKPQSYFATYNEAYAALVNYNKNPYSLEPDLTLNELYEKWIEHEKKTKSPNTIKQTISQWKKLEKLHNINVRDLRTYHIKEFFDESGYNAYMISRLKSILNNVLDYALERELVDRNYSRNFKLDNTVSKEIEKNRKAHLQFSEEEISALYSSDNYYAMVTLFQCWTGMRPGELGLVKISDVRINERYIIGGIKTEAGKDRLIPLNEHVIPILENIIKYAEDNNSEYLFFYDKAKIGDARLNYDRYRVEFKELIAILNLNPEHKAHDPRMHFVTMAKKYKLDDNAIKRIVGHKINDVTEAVYTNRPLSWYLEEVNKISAI